MLQGNIAVNLLNLILDPDLTLFDFHNRYRVEVASRRAKVLDFFRVLEEEPADLLLLNNVNPVFSIPPSSGVKEALRKDNLFVLSFSNFMDETTEVADLILPVQLPLETWDEYGGTQAIVSTMQPAMGSLTGAPNLGDVFLHSAFGGEKPAGDFMWYLYEYLLVEKAVRNERDWVKALRQGGIFESSPAVKPVPKRDLREGVLKPLESLSDPPASDLAFITCPSIRFFDGRGANRPWLCEVPDPLTRIAWQTPVMMHPETLTRRGLKQGDIIEIRSKWGTLEAPAYETEGVRRNVVVMFGSRSRSLWTICEKNRAEPQPSPLCPNRTGMVFALNCRSSSISVQSAGIFCPPISQKNSHKNKIIKKEKEGFGSTAYTAAIAPEVLTAPLKIVRR